MTEKCDNKLQPTLDILISKRVNSVEETDYL